MPAILETSVADPSAVHRCQVARNDIVPTSPSLIARTSVLCLRVVRWIYGALAILFGLAVLATLPVLNLMSLGYLLEASGRVAKSGRLRDGWIGVEKAGRVASLVLGAWIVSLPIFYVAQLWRSARLIDPGSYIARNWSWAFAILSLLTAAHIWSVCLRGGHLYSFLLPRPFHFLRHAFQKGAYAQVRDATCNLVSSLRPLYYFWLGFRGFFGAFLWLAVPATMLGLAPRLHPAYGPIVGITGGLLLAYVLLHLPFLQTQLAVKNRFAAVFDLDASRRVLRNVPLTSLVAISATLLLSLPLYLFKIEILPQEALWLPSILFVLSIFPARILAGWTFAYAQRRSRSRPLLLRIFGRTALVPVIAFYVLMVYLSQYVHWNGVVSLYEQHAFLVPVPFLGL